MKIRILKSFRYGSVSDPKRLTAGNIQEVPVDASDGMVAQWFALKWVEEIKEV